MANKKVSQLTSKPSVLTTDLFPIADPSTGQLYKTTISDLGTAIGSGVSSVNSLVGAVVLDTDDIQELVSPTNKWFTDTRARAALSASSPLTYNSGTGAFGIQVANGSQNGYLSSSDWTTFNSKQAALSGTGFVKISGTTISYDNSTYLTTSDAASTYLALAGGTLTGALNGTSATFTGDLTISSTNPRIYLTDTDNNPDYFISNTDGTFTIYDVTNSTSRLTISTLNTILNTNLRVDGDVLIKQDSVFGGVAGYTGIGSDSSGIFLKLGTATSHAYLVLSGLTSYRNFTLPDATGTFALTSDLGSYLPLSGGTLTGALSGTSVSLSSSVTATRLILSGGTPNTGLYFGHTDKVVLANYTVGGGIDFETNGGNITMQLSSAGILSTTSDIVAGDGTGSVSMAINRGAAGNSNGLRFRTAGTNNWYIGSGATGANTNLEIYNHNTATTNLLLNYSTGAATFSSSVSGISHRVYNGATTIGYLIRAADWGDSGNNLGIAAETTLGINFYTNGSATPKVIINSSGLVGIGTTSPGKLLHLYASNDNASIRFTNTAANKVWDLTPALPNVSNTGFTLYNVTDSKIGLHVTDGGELHLLGASTTYNNGAFIYNTDTTFDLYPSNTSGIAKATRFFYNGGSGQTMQLHSNGAVSIGTTSDTGRKFSVAGTINIHGANNAIQTITKSISSGGTANFSMNSDYGYGLGDNISGFFVVTISEPTTDVGYNAAAYTGMVINPRGGNATVTQIAKSQGAGITSFTVTNSTNDISVSATASDGSALKVNLVFIGGGGTN